MCQVRVVEVDACHFIAASRVGDRITIAARVNLCSGHAMEVGVTVYAEDVSGSGRRKINQGELPEYSHLPSPATSPLPPIAQASSCSMHTYIYTPPSLPRLPRAICYAPLSVPLP